jgi:nitroreductase
MDVIDPIRQRRSIREYADAPVERDKLLRVLEAARLAPSANNRQEWRFVVVTDPQTRERLVPACSNQKFIGQAPVVIAACAEHANYVMRCGQLAYPIDVAIAVDHMTLQAAAEGLGTCWIGSFYEDQVKTLLKIPRIVTVVELLTLGYPAGPPSPLSRLPLESIVRWERWS